MVWALILSLKKTITHQNIAIESAKTEIQEIKAGQEDLQKENAKLQEEIQSLRSQIEAQTLYTPKTWAAVAAAAARNTPEQPPNAIIPRLRKEPNCVRISTAATLDEDIDNERFTRFLPTEAANPHIRTELLNAETTKEVHVAGIGTTKTGYVIRFRDAQSAETSRNNTEWLDELGNETKVVKPRFGIVVHRVSTEELELKRTKNR
ncbi:hypothetical protein CBS63078_10961 [Aspergillus niger]|nr:hypothetical protein CBS13152_11232 [Aspergillus niger]KAI2868492.1 hypothetical protein CBS11852_11350 [Aspergillus niger]KAI2886504.1 hypothetical protein CBS63078_10961 [Aspergillus niger]KAI3015334.1 hypothetical protein CBS147347_11250 [Aspergillus niger]KAI3033487.1 hypothetical protein CBS76997_11285 [Aspergillus niger]